MSNSFNYIAFGNWDLVQGQVDKLEMPRGRMFEHTPTDIEKRLEDLGPTSIEYLEKLPTFLCSEISSSRQGASMLIKLGKISGIEVGRKEVATDFETSIDFGEVTFPDVESARQIFGSDGFQLYRTHWSVKEGDVGEILNRLAALKPGTVGQAPESDTNSAAEPPPREKKIIGSADSVESFLAHLYSFSPTDSTETFFRGHENASFELTPSLLRKGKDGSWLFMPHEYRLCKELLIAHYDEFQGDQYCFDRLVRMQHYGLPTRLLDISSNPLVALFFACFGSAETMNMDGEVIVFRIESDRVKYFDSDTVSCVANLSNLTYEQKSQIDLTLNVDAFNETEVAHKLLHHIKSEKGFFEGRIVPDDLGSIVCVKAKRTNNRIKSQSGAFLLFGHEITLPEFGQQGIEIARIRVTNKQHILNQLDSINVNATAVYPSIDRTAFHLRARHQG